MPCRFASASGQRRPARRRKPEVVDYVDQAGTRRLKTFAKKKEADAWSQSTGVALRDGTHVADAATVTVCEAAGSGGQTLTSPRAKVHVHQRADRYQVIGMPKSDAGQRTIPIGPFVINTLKEEAGTP